MADRAHLLSDEDLLRALAASFPVEPVEPDPALLHQLSLAVAELRQRTTPAPAHAARRLRWTLPRRLSPAFLAAAVIGVVGAGTGISYAVGVPIPAAVRSIVRSVGLAQPAPPSTPPAPAVNAARQAESTLHQALTESHPPLSVIWRDSTVLAHRLARVGGPAVAGATGTTANGQRLLHQACRQLEGSGLATAGSASADAGGNGATFPGCAPVGVGHSPSGSTSTPSTFPSTTRPTEVPNSTQPGGGPVKAPVGGSGRTYGTTPTGGTTGTTTPGTSPGHSPGGSSTGHGGSGQSSGSQAHLPGHATTAKTTYPRSGDPSG